MNGLAQTNVQLFNQLAAHAYSESDVAYVGRAYGLAMSLFSAVYRSSGKTFVAHAVGTASALVPLRARRTLVVAALLHAAYAHGDFGSADRVASDRKRARVRAIVGDEAEALVYGYTCFAWNEDAVYAAGRPEHVPTPGERDVLLLRLANEADEFEDLAAHYAPDRDRRIAAARTHLSACARLAELLGATDLAARLTRARELTLGPVAVAPLLSLPSRGESVLVPPASYALRARVRLRRLARRLRRRNAT